MTWETVRAATLRIGDVTPAGPITAIDYYGDLRRISITIAGQTYSRGFDEQVDRELVDNGGPAGA